MSPPTAPKVLDTYLTPLMFGPWLRQFGITSKQFGITYQSHYILLRYAK
jgi:hypothetical protein